MSTDVQKDLQAITQARAQGRLATAKVYFALAGPGWLQSAATLGGGSLAGSLYLGILAGPNMLWLQPLAMILGIIMLSAISYVTLSTGEPPFRTMRRHVSPVLAWAWLAATVAANLVWTMPQFSLGGAAVRQNLLPSIFGPDAMPVFWSKLIIGVAMAAIAISVVRRYGQGSRGVKIFENILKVFVGIIVLCFVGVVIRLTIAGDVISWGQVARGFAPDLSLLTTPAPGYDAVLGRMDPAARDFWTGTILNQQRDVMIATVATAVGINMTFFMPYILLAKGWSKEFRGLATFDLSTGLLIPFAIATSCVVIASSSQFHTRPAPGLLGETDASGQAIVAPGHIRGSYDRLISARIASAGGQVEARDLPEAERQVAAMLAKRDAFDLANALTPLTGTLFSQFVFGFGVLAMTVSTIVIMMLMNGFAISEALAAPRDGWAFKIGTLMPLVGILGPFLWSKAAFWLAVPVSVFGMCLLPIAYVSFYLMMNSRRALGHERPAGLRRWRWNGLMALSVSLATMGSLYSIWSKTHWVGIVSLALLVVVALVAHGVRRSSSEHTT
jgi:Mn2+/Fe2+ NRAMP family transporter